MYYPVYNHLTVTLSEIKQLIQIIKVPNIDQDILICIHRTQNAFHQMVQPPSQERVFKSKSQFYCFLFTNIIIISKICMIRDGIKT